MMAGCGEGALVHMTLNRQVKQGHDDGGCGAAILKDVHLPI